MATAADLEPPGVPVVERLELAAECLRLLFAWNLSLQAFPVFPAEQALFALLAPDSVAALLGHAARTGISAVVAHAAAPLVGDTGPPNIPVDRQAAGLALEQPGGPICPNRFYAVPNHGPSGHPNVAAHPSATR